MNKLEEKKQGPPAHLSAQAKDLWSKLSIEYDLSDYRADKFR